MSEKELYTVRAVQRALNILECFTFEESEQDLNQLSEKLGLHKSTIHRLVKNLEHEGFLEKKPKQEIYKLGIKVFRLGMVVHETMGLRKVAQPIMNELAEEAGFTVFLSVIQNGQKVCVEKVRGGHGLQPSIRVGQVVPLHVGSSGRVLLSYMTEEEVDKILDNHLSAFTPNTIIDKNTLKEQLAEIRRNGYAVGFEEKIIGGAGISAPLITYNGRVEIAISLAGPANAIRNNEKLLVPMVINAAKKISSELGNI